MAEKPPEGVSLQTITEGLAAIVSARKLMAQACQAEIDCAAYAAAADVLERRLLAMRQQWFGE